MEDWLALKGFIYSAIYKHSEYAHWIIFSSLILAGFNVPVSEDIMLIISGALASTIVPHRAFQLFVAVFLGCYLSDWIAYWLGRKLGYQLWEIHWFRKMLPKERYQKLQRFYSQYGGWVLLLGRFIPFGVRNGLFITAGMSKWSFPLFLLFDGIACFLSNSLLFSLAYRYGDKVSLLFSQVKIVNLILFAVFLICFFLAFIIWNQKKKKKNVYEDHIAKP